MIEPIRLLAFAFAGADFLFEIDRQGTILFVTGATSGFSQTPDPTGHSGAALFVSGEQARFTVIARGMQAGDRVGPLPMTLASGEKASLSMCFLPGSDRISCTLVKIGKRGTLATGKDKETGLANRDTFMAAVAEYAGGTGAVAMVDVPELPNLCAKLSTEEAADLMAGIGANVKAIGAIIAARLSQTRFGVISKDPQAAKGLAATIQGAVRERGLEPPKVEEVFVSLKGVHLSAEQNLLALRHAIGRFADGAIKTLPSGDLEAVFDRLMDETLQKAQAFNVTIADGAFDLAFEPIVDLRTGTTSHYEALTRFQPDQSPAETIRFAEELGLSDNFDVAVALKAITLLESSPLNDASVAINVSGRSIANPPSFAMLAGLLSRKRALAKRVLIEITETAAIADVAAADRALQSLRQMGYRVGIDDFGSGAASLQYLHGFSVDFIKVDGGLIERLGKSPREDALLKSVLATCAELKIETIAEWIDSPEKLSRCTDIGFRFGQGRHFGTSLTELPKPVAAPTPAPAAARARRKGVQETWQ